MADSAVVDPERTRETTDFLEGRIFPLRIPPGVRTLFRTQARGASKCRAAVADHDNMVTGDDRRDDLRRILRAMPCFGH